MAFTEKTLETEQVFKGRVLDVQRLTVELDSGDSGTREIVYHGGGVCVLARTADNKLLFVRQFRKAAEKELLEIPAGKLEKGEDPEKCGLRELEEETGYSCRIFKKLTHFYPTPGYSSEIIHIYFADVLVKGKQHLDEDEFLSVESYTLAEAEEMIKNGEITDGKTIIAILMGKELVNA